MLKAFVSTTLRWPVFVAALVVGVVAVGLYAYRQLDIEAYPNPVPPMIELITQPPGWSSEEVERYVTVPLEVGLAGMPGLDHVRSQSLFGLSDVKCYFNWNVSYQAARQEVINRLQFIQLPNGMQAQISPWNAIGEIYRYVLRGKGYSLTDLKTAQDWILEKQFRQVPGVADVVGFGGLTKQYQIEVDPIRLKTYNITLSQIINSVGNANQNVGGQRLALGEQSYNIRGIGLIRSLRDIEHIVVGQAKGTPIRVRDLAQVKIDAAPRLGQIGKDLEEDIVQGIVLMRYGEDSLKTIAALHQRVDHIRKFRLLPPGMEIEPYYDRANLVQLTTHTVLENLLLGMLLVTAVLWLFLGHVRAALITAINIPLSLLIAFIGMVASGTPANLISLGAVDFGIVVESTVIMVENGFRKLGPQGEGSLTARIIAAAGEVGPPLLFSTSIIAVAFIPLFTLTGVAGVIFAPMAHTYAFAIGGALLLALTLTPALVVRTLKVEAHEEADNWLMRRLKQFYFPIFAFALARRKTAVAIAAIPVLVALGCGTLLGREFMPKLEEGNFWIRATLPSSISLDQAAKYVGKMRRLVLGCAQPNGACPVGSRRRPAILTVVSQIGRPDDGTDVSGFYNIELYAPLKPADEWPHGVTKETMTEELSAELRQAFPGVTFNFSQAIADNVEEAISGVKGENTVKVVGPDLRVNEAKAQEICNIMGQVRGVTDLGVFRSLGQPDIRITPDRIMCARYGLNVGDVEAVVQGAIGGQALTQVWEGEKRFDLTVRWAEPFRKDLRAIRGILISTSEGAQVPLGQLAQIVIEEGPSLIYREDNSRYIPVKFSVRGRDLASTIGEAQQKIDAAVKLPYDTHLEWAGEINQLNETTGRLMIIIPVTLLLILLLVFALVKTWKDTCIVFAGIPVAVAGGILALIVTRTDFSISAAMGFVSIFGISIQDALIVVTYAQSLWKQGHSVRDGARLAVERRLRPALMTVTVALLGLLPAALSHGIGSETQKPLAIVVIGGALILAFVPRLLLPALLAIVH